MALPLQPLPPAARGLLALVASVVLLVPSARAQAVVLQEVHGLGAVPFPGGSPAIATAPPFEAALLATLGAGGAFDPAAPVLDGAGTEFSWKALPAVGAYLSVDLDETFGTLAPSVAYLAIRLDSDVARRQKAWCGSDDGLRLWLNGVLQVEAAVPRGLAPRAHQLDLDLRPGANWLLAKVTQEGGAWGFSLELPGPVSIEEKHRLQPAIDEAIDRGVAYLLSTQEPDGSWRFHQDKYVNGQTALSLFALLKSGLTIEHEAIQRAKLWLTSNLPTMTYSCGCQMLAVAELRDPDLQGHLEELTELMLDWQTSTGWAYPTSHVDLSNHQFALLGLRAAAESGIPIRAKVWNSAAEQALHWQHDDGGFSYKDDKDPTGSMTAAGLTVLGVCREQLAKQGKLPAGRERDWNQAAEEALDWLAREWDPTKNPVPWVSEAEEARWFPYYLYGVERVGAFFERSHLGEHDWYWEGARTLVGRQGNDGEWTTTYGEGQPNTCFALLFLERATAALSGGARKDNGWGERDATADVRLRGTGEGPVTVWLDGLGAELLAEFGWPAADGGGLRVRRVEYLLDGAVARTLDGDPSTPHRAERFAAKLDEVPPGEHTVAARVVLARPGGAEDAVVESATFPLQVARAAAPWMRDYALDRTRNVLAGTRFEVTASTEAQDEKFARGMAFDNLLGTCWLASKEDALPWIEIELRKPLKASELVLSHARPNDREPFVAARATRVAIVLNGKDKRALEVDLDPDPLRKTIVPFGRIETVRTLRVQVYASEPGEKRGSQVGFAELELRRDR